jgi:hypothetical protein
MDISDNYHNIKMHPPVDLITTLADAFMFLFMH